MESNSIRPIGEVATASFSSGKQELKALYFNILFHDNALCNAVLVPISNGITTGHKVLDWSAAHDIILKSSSGEKVRAVLKQHNLKQFDAVIALKTVLRRFYDLDKQWKVVANKIAHKPATQPAA